jgi:hypothetical protein
LPAGERLVLEITQRRLGQAAQHRIINALSGEGRDRRAMAVVQTHEAERQLESRHSVHGQIAPIPATKAGISAVRKRTLQKWVSRSASCHKRTYSTPRTRA